MLPHPEAYFPKSAIRDDKAYLFVGRDELLFDAVRALSGEGSSMIIYGERGVGKTSLAWRVMSILENVHKKGYENYAKLLPKRNYRCIWFETKEYTKDINDLLIQLLRVQPDRRSMSKRCEEVYQDEALLAHVKRTYEVGIPKLASAKYEFDDLAGAGDYALEAREMARDGNRIRHLFEDITQTVALKYPDEEIIVFIDEFDLLIDPKGVGSLIKTASGIKFVIIGVADDLDKLLLDHPSVSRKLYGSDIEVPGLSSQHIRSIFTTATKKTDGALTFSEAFLQNAVVIN